MRQVQKKSFAVEIDLLRVIAIFGVLLIHLAYPIYARTDFFGGSTWWFATVLISFSRISVPLFIVLSGYLLIPKNESWNNTKVRIVNRLIIPFIFWFTTYTAWYSFYNSQPISIPDIIAMLYQSNAYHLYFLIILIGLYVLLPLCRWIVLHSEKKYVTTIIAVSFFVGFLMYFLPYTSIFRDQPQFSTFTAWLPYLGYFLFGGLVATRNIQSFRHAGKIFVASLITTVLLSSYVVLQRYNQASWLWRDHGVSFVDEFLSPNIIVMTLSFFILIMSLKAEITSLPSWLTKTIRSLSTISFGAYLVHSIVLNILDTTLKLNDYLLNGRVIEYFGIRSILCVVISFFISWLLTRIPVLKRTVGIT